MPKKFNRDKPYPCPKRSDRTPVFGGGHKSKTSSLPGYDSELQAKWEERLKREGLGAILPSGNPFVSGTVNHHITPLAAKAEYFRLLSHHVHDADFPTEIDRAIMTWWSEGCNMREIHQKLYVRDGYRRYPRTLKQVRYTVRHYENVWGIKKWTDKERGL